MTKTQDIKKQSCHNKTQDAKKPKISKIKVWATQYNKNKKQKTKIPKQFNISKKRRCILKKDVPTTKDIKQYQKTRYRKTQGIKKDIKKTKDTETLKISKNLRWHKQIRNSID